MEEIIQQLADKFNSKLPKKNFYDLDYLGTYGYPAFLVQHLKHAIQIEIKKQLDRVARRWVKRKSDEVQQTEQLFLTALLDEARLPADSADDFIENSLNQILKIAIQSRQNIPAILFEDEDKLSKKEIEEKVKFITIYQHFGQVLAGYMNRKQRTELTREQCQNIIANVDEKLTQNYSPQQWAQLLNPLFVLFGGQVEPRLFRLFFEDKNMHEKAEFFGQTEEKIDREKFIETLTSASAGSSKSFQRLEEAAPDDEPKKKSNFSPPSPAIPEEYKGTEEPQANNASETEPSEAESREKTEKKDNEESINVRFAEAETQNKSINDIFAAEQTKEEKKNDENRNINSRLKTGQKEKGIHTKKEDSATPMWKRFVGGEKPASTPNDDRNVKEATNTPKTVNKKQKTSLKQHLAGRQELFVDELFGGSQAEYEKNIAKIAKKENWQEAIHTIRDDIFEKNDINIYSPAAITFTDRLQDYFNE